MRHFNSSIALLLFFSTGVLSGCHTTHASPAASRPSPAAASPAKRSAAPSSAPSLAHPSKHPPRDSEFAVYHNPVYGVSFRYPRNYLLQEQPPEPDEADFAASALFPTQHDLDAVQPGSILLATVLIPDDAYPNTTFRSGGLQLVAHPGVTPHACQSYGSPSDSSSPGTAGTLTIHGIIFDWWLRGSAAAGAYSESVTYAGFSSGVCYEFFLQVVSTPAADSALPAAPADLAKILRPLEKSVSSFQLHTAPPTTAFCERN